jgi:hypothetical protein
MLPQYLLQFKNHTSRSGWLALGRALRGNGLIPTVIPKGANLRPVESHDLPEIKAWIQARQNGDVAFDYVIEGRTSGNTPDELATIQMWKDAGMTWWIESLWDASNDEQRARLQQGPPRLEQNG